MITRERMVTLFGGEERVKALEELAKFRKLDFNQGFYFGMGIWVSFFIFTFIILPIIGCVVAIFVPSLAGGLTK